jgi:hypothetical protein
MVVKLKQSCMCFNIDARKYAGMTIEMALARPECVSCHGTTKELINDVKTTIAPVTGVCPDHGSVDTSDACPERD